MKGKVTLPREWTEFEIAQKAHSDAYDEVRDFLIQNWDEKTMSLNPTKLSEWKELDAKLQRLADERNRKWHVAIRIIINRSVA